MFSAREKFLELRTFVEKIESKFSQTTGILKFSHEILPKIPELKFHLSELFSYSTQVPFDGADLICAEGRLNFHEIGENA